MSFFGKTWMARFWFVSGFSIFIGGFSTLYFITNGNFSMSGREILSKWGPLASLLIAAPFASVLCFINWFLKGMIDDFNIEGKDEK